MARLGFDAEVLEWGGEIYGFRNLFFFLFIECFLSHLLYP